MVRNPSIEPDTLKTSNRFYPSQHNATALPGCCKAPVSEKTITVIDNSSDVEILAG